MIEGSSLCIAWSCYELQSQHGEENYTHCAPFARAKVCHDCTSRLLFSLVSPAFNALDCSTCQEPPRLRPIKNNVSVLKAKSRPSTQFHTRSRRCADFLGAELRFYLTPDPRQRFERSRRRCLHIQHSHQLHRIDAFVYTFPLVVV